MICIIGGTGLGDEMGAHWPHWLIHTIWAIGGSLFLLAVIYAIYMQFFYRFPDEKDD